MLSAGWQEGRRLVSSETPCICNGFSLEMLVCPTVEVAPKRWLFFRGSFAFHLRQAHFLITPGGHSERPIFLIFSSFLLISQLLHGISVEIQLVLSMSRFYCEEQSLGGIIIYSSIIYFTQQTSNTQGAGCSLVDYILNWTLQFAFSI